MAIGDGVSAIASLGVCFGGFSPTAMDGVAASKEQVERMEALQAEKKEAMRRRLELERSRTSKPRTYQLDGETTISYVVVDDSLVRIVRCMTESSDLVLPGCIEGMPVYAIGPEACSELSSVRRIICPDSVETIGSCAFRLNENLAEIHLPTNVMEYSASWLSHCPKLVVLELPGKLDRISSSVFDNASIERLVVGEHVSLVVPGAFQKTQLHSIEVDERNPFLSCDGMALYNKDKTRLLALARPVTSYRVADGCKILAKKSFYGIESLRQVELPQSVEVLESYCFAHSGLEEFCPGEGVRRIGEHAFYHCKDLQSSVLPDGLQVIEDCAFEESALSALDIPASIQEIGSSVTLNTKVVHSGPQCSLTIGEGPCALFLDGNGGLYRREGDDVRMIQLIDRSIADYAVHGGATIIGVRAFAHNQAIRRVRVPQGVTTVEESAFRCCGALESVQLPSTVRAIGADAFLDTALVSLELPAGLQELGANALVTKGAHHGDEVPSLRKIVVAPENEGFSVQDGVLYRRVAEGTSAVMFTSSCAEVSLRDDTVAVESYAFNNARGIRYFRINPKLASIGTNGLTTWCWIERILVEVAQPVEGRTRFEFGFPDTRKGVHGISMGLGGASWVNVAGIMSQYDNAVVNAHDYNASGHSDSIAIYDQAKMVVQRLKDPILLTKVNRSMYERLLRNHVTEMCVDIARHDDRALMDDLMDLGYVTGDNLEPIIAQVGRLQDAAMTAYLLEAKRRRFNEDLFDFDL